MAQHNLIPTAELQRRDPNSASPVITDRDPDFMVDLGRPSTSDAGLATLHLLWVHRTFLFRAALYALLISLLVSFLIPKRYEATARLMPPEQTGSVSLLLGALVGKGSAMGPLAEDALGMKTTGDLFAAILQSRTVENEVVKKFDLQKVYRTRYFEDACKELADHTNIANDHKSGIITLNVTDRDSQRAAGMAAEYVAQLNWVLNNVTTSSARRERVFLEERLKQVNVELEGAEQQFSRFASQNGTIDIQSQGKAMVEAAATLQGEVIAAQSQLNGLRQIYTDSNVRVQSLQARIAELRRQLEKLGGKGVDENSPADNLYPSIRQLPVLGVDYADLLRKVKVQEAVFEALTQQYELAKVEEAKEIPTARLLDPPLVPEKKSFPPRLLITILGGIAGFALAITYLLARRGWGRIDNCDPRKLFAREVMDSIRTRVPWTSAHTLRMRVAGDGWAEAPDRSLVHDSEPRK